MPTWPKDSSTATSPAAFVIDAHDRNVVAKYHARVDSDLFATDVLALLGTWYNTCLIGVESNNHGLSTLKALQGAKYRNIFRQHRMGQRFDPTTELLGWRTTRATKAVAIDELVKEIRDGLLNIPCAETIRELKTFVREGNGRMHGSPYDDRTMALAIAVQMLKYVWLPQYQADVKPGPGTMGWWEAKLYPAERRQTRIRIGQHQVRGTIARGA